MKKIVLLNILMALIFLVLGALLCAYIPLISEKIHQHDGIALLKYGVWFAALIAAVNWLSQSVQASLKMEVELALKMSEKFDSEQMVRHRVYAARALLDHEDEPNKAIDAILNYFEEIEYLLDKRAVSTEVVWRFFSFWIIGYFHATTKYREEYLDYDASSPATFAGIKLVYDKILKLEKKESKKHKNQYKEYDDEDVELFLKEEYFLMGKPKPFHIGNMGAKKYS